MVENDGQQADIALRAGLETAYQTQEQTIDDAIPPYTVGEGTPAEEAARKADAAVAAAATTAEATATFIAERRRLHEAHREARAVVDRWRETLAYAKERKRRLKQRGLPTETIMKVQTRAADRRRDAAESEEDFCNDTVAMN